jgi:hypothetical protein
MPASRAKNVSPLDNLRRRHGDRRLCDIFHNRCEQGEKAGDLLDDERLSFPALYLLWPEIRKHGLESSLNARNSRALEIATLCLSRGQAGPYRPTPEDVPVLRWMLRSGHAEEGLGAQYDAVMDGAAICLAREHGDASRLPEIARMIFSRHRKGHYTHDAEWAFFESHDPRCIALVARGLLSENGSDVELARRLLGFIPCFDALADDPARQYRCALRWLSENRKSLAYTGEGSQESPAPRRFAATQGPDAQAPGEEAQP